MLSAAFASACAAPIALVGPTRTVAESGVDGARPYACRFEYEVDDLGPDPDGADWLSNSPQDVRTELEAEGAGVTVYEHDWASGWSPRIRIGGRIHSAVGARGHGGVAVAFSPDWGTLAFASTAMRDEYAAIEERNAVRPRISVHALVPVSDGWWIIALATWQTQHFAWAPPEWQFVHVGTDGHVLGRVHARFVGSQIADPELELIHAAGDELRALFPLRTADGRVWHGLAIRPRRGCQEPGVDACTAVVEERVSSDRSLAEGEWGRAYDEVLREESLIRFSERGDEQWRVRLGRLMEIADPIVVDESVIAVTVGMGHYLSRESRAVTVHTLDASTGAESSADVLPSSQALSACVARAGTAIIVGVAGEDSLSLTTLDGERLWSVDGGWSECAIAVLADRYVIAATRIEGSTSAGLDTSLVVHVVMRDGEHVSTIEAPPRSGIRGTQPRVVVGADGVWLSWSGSAWQQIVWRFDAAGRPDGEPRRLGLLYFFPATRLVMTTLGPSLAWSTSTEQGLVPLCHAEGRQDRAVTVPFGEAWP